MGARLHSPGSWRGSGRAPGPAPLTNPSTIRPGFGRGFFLPTAPAWRIDASSKSGGEDAVLFCESAKPNEARIGGLWNSVHAVYRGLAGHVNRPLRPMMPVPGAAVRIRAYQAGGEDASARSGGEGGADSVYEVYRGFLAPVNPFP